MAVMDAVRRLALRNPRSMAFGPSISWRIDGAERSSLKHTDWRQIIIQNDRTIVFWQWDDTPVSLAAGSI